MLYDTALQSFPWLSGLFLEHLVKTSYPDQKLKRLIASSCLANKSVYLDLDPGFDETTRSDYQVMNYPVGARDWLSNLYHDPTTTVYRLLRLKDPVRPDALTTALEANKGSLMIEYLLFDIIQQLWCILHTSAPLFSHFSVHLILP